VSAAGTPGPDSLDLICCCRRSFHIVYYIDDNFLGTGMGFPVALP